MNANHTAILGHVSNGIACSGDMRSARIYYEENSQFVAASGGNPARGLTLGVLNNQAFGPVSLPNAWDDYFSQTLDEDGNVIEDGGGRRARRPRRSSAVRSRTACARPRTSRSATC